MPNLVFLALFYTDMDSRIAEHGYIDSGAVHACFSICFMASDMLAFLPVLCIFHLQKPNT